MFFKTCKIEFFIHSTLFQYDVEFKITHLKQNPAFWNRNIERRGLLCLPMKSSDCWPRLNEGFQSLNWLRFPPKAKRVELVGRTIAGQVSWQMKSAFSKGFCGRSTVRLIIDFKWNSYYDRNGLAGQFWQWWKEPLVMLVVN